MTNLNEAHSVKSFPDFRHSGANGFVDDDVIPTSRDREAYWSAVARRDRATGRIRRALTQRRLDRAKRRLEAAQSITVQ